MVCVLQQLSEIYFDQTFFKQDAHNSILNFDTDTSFFAVYDGHGGAEVAQYCADKLPEFLKTLENYKGGNLEQALKDAFLGFDKTLLDPAVVHTLKILAGDHEDDDENLDKLHEESKLPLNEVLEQYQGLPQTHDLALLKSDSDVNKSVSTSIRGRRAAAVAAEAVNKAVMDPSAKPAGSSTSAAAAAAAAAALNEIDGPGPSCSRSSKLEPEDESTVSSSSSSNASKNTNSTINNLKDGSVTSKTPGAVSKTDGVAPTEQNGNVTSSEAKAIVSTGNENATTSEDATVSGSSDIADAKSNGNIENSVSKRADATDISSTSKESDKSVNKAAATQEDDSTDDDADYDESELMKAKVIDAADSSSDEEEDGQDDDDDDDDEDDEVSLTP